MLLYFFIISIIIIVFSFLKNLLLFIRSKKAKERFLNWSNNPSSPYKYRQETLYLINQAKLPDVFVPELYEINVLVSTPQNKSAKEEFPSNNPPFLSIQKQMLEDTISIFRLRIFDTINPLNWIDTVIHLPSRLISFISQNPGDSKPKRIADIVYWILGVAIGCLSSAYADLLRVFFEKIF